MEECYRIALVLALFFFALLPVMWLWEWVGVRWRAGSFFWRGFPRRWCKFSALLGAAAAAGYLWVIQDRPEPIPRHLWAAGNVWCAGAVLVFVLALWHMRHASEDALRLPGAAYPYVTTAFAGWCLFALSGGWLGLDTALNLREFVASQEPVLKSEVLVYAGISVCALGVAVHGWRASAGRKAGWRPALESPRWGFLPLQLLVLGAIVYLLPGLAMKWIFEPAYQGAGPLAASFREGTLGSLALIMALKSRAALRAACGSDGGRVDWDSLWNAPALNMAVAQSRLFNLEIDGELVAFRDTESVKAYLEAQPDVEIADLGLSREGQPLWGFRFGTGTRSVSILAGAHADEPAGPMTALALPVLMRAHFPELLEQYRFHVVPQINPDGAERNRPWMRAETRFAQFLDHRVRELPGEDVEFGFGEGDGVRPECTAAQTFLASAAPFALHCSLHGMDLAEGAWFLLCREWDTRCDPLMDALAAVCAGLGMPLLDIDRRGEKGFTRLRAGFSTTPRSDAMRDFFSARNEPETANRFLPSSMEWVRGLGGDPLCMVSEIPLFRVSAQAGTRQAAAADFKAELEPLRAQPGTVWGEALEQLLERHELAAMPWDMQMRLQLAMIVLALLHCAEPPAETA